jgi:hypothetical protein
LSLRGDFALGFLNNVRTVKTMGTLGDELYAFCIVRWPWARGGMFLFAFETFLTDSCVESLVLIWWLYFGKCWRFGR